MHLQAKLTLALVALAACAASCTPHLEYPAPAQRSVEAGAEIPLSRVIQASSPEAQSYVAGEVQGAEMGAPWRWTNQRPRFKMTLEGAANWVFYARFTTPKVVLDRTGPLTVTFIVNDTEIATRQYNEDGEKEIRVPVDEGVLRKASPVVFGFDVDKAYVAEDGVKLCVLLSAMGFEEAARQ